MEFKFGGGASQCITSVWTLPLHCTHVYQGVFSILLFAVSSQVYKNYNWQHASAELAICTACVEGCRWSIQCYCMHYMITCVVGESIILADFNLAVSTQTAK